MEDMDEVNDEPDGEQEQSDQDDDQDDHEVDFSESEPEEEQPTAAPQDVPGYDPLGQSGPDEGVVKKPSFEELASEKLVQLKGSQQAIETMGFWVCTHKSKASQFARAW